MRKFQHVKSRVDRSGVRTTSGAQHTSLPCVMQVLSTLLSIDAQAPKEEASGQSPPKPRKSFLRKSSRHRVNPPTQAKPFRREGPRKPAVPRATDAALLVRHTLHDAHCMLAETHKCLAP